MGKRVFAFVLVVLLLCALSCPVFASSDGDTIVYRTRTGECYHRGSCSYLQSSKIEITLADAVSRGLRPCSRCSPPRYVAESTTKAAQEPTTAPSYSSSTKEVKTTKSTSAGGNTGIKVLAYLIGIVSLASIGNYLYGKFRRL